MTRSLLYSNTINIIHKALTEECLYKWKPSTCQKQTMILFTWFSARRLHTEIGRREGGAEAARRGAWILPQIGAGYSKHLAVVKGTISTTADCVVRDDWHIGHKKEASLCLLQLLLCGLLFVAYVILYTTITTKQYVERNKSHVNTKHIAEILCIGYTTVWSELCECIRANSLQTVL